ncbi:unnamed protein product [Moneuplotes crassus]|uniref:Uncharacterized protein n=1 Tax=Euplotes crassus TaxID=5936 RepID=A0AAD1X769_EUPCR|nr:unnamed protein product [Moneuplotes crassus]
MSRSYLIKRLDNPENKNSRYMKKSSQNKKRVSSIVEEYRNLNTFLEQYQGRMKAGGSSIQRMRALRKCESPKIDFISYSLTRQSVQRPTIDSEFRERKGLRMRANELREKVKSSIRESTSEWRHEVQKVVDKVERRHHFSEWSNKFNTNRSYHDVSENTRNCYSSFSYENTKKNDNIKIKEKQAYDTIDAGPTTVRVEQKRLPKVRSSHLKYVLSKSNPKKSNVCNSARPVERRGSSKKKQTKMKLKNLKISIMKECNEEKFRNVSIKNLLQKFSNDSRSLFKALQSNSARVQQTLTNSRVEQRYENFNPGNRCSNLSKIISKSSKSYQEIP